MNVIKRRKYKDNPYILINSGNKYIITFIDSSNQKQEVPINKNIYEVFNQSELHDLSELNEYDRHIEHFVLSDESLFYKRNSDCNSLEQVVENRFLNEELYDAINTLSIVQKRRIIMYYFKDLNLREIATIEHCSITSVKESIDSALVKLRKKIKK